MSELESARQRITGLEDKLAETQRQLDLLVRYVFGRRSERTPPPAHPAQMDQELEAENAAIENAPPARPAKAKGGSKKGRKVRGESGVKLSAATLCQTIAKLADAAEPVVRCLAQAMWRDGYVQLDLTPVRCLSREHAGGSFLVQMWVAAVPRVDVLYTWDRSKEIVAERIVPEAGRGVLQTDGGSELGCYLRGGKSRDKPRPDFIRAACWVHARRKFFEGAKAGCKRCAQLLKVINALFPHRRRGPCRRSRYFTLIIPLRGRGVDRLKAAHRPIHQHLRAGR